MKNPFQFGKLAEAENFIDRVEDRKILKGYLTSGINVILMSPRRWGKSSLVNQTVKEILRDNKDIRVCQIDAFPVKSVNEFYRVFAESVIKSTASTLDQLVANSREFFKSIVPKITIGPDVTAEFSLGIDFKDKQIDKKEILNLPEEIALKKGIDIIVCIDEFQELAELDGFDELERELRSVWQQQTKCTYCLYGSHRHMMSEIFDSPEKPFYKFGQPIHMQKIAEADWIEYIVSSFEKTGKAISRQNAAEICKRVKSHSWYVQQYSAAVWNFTDDGDEATGETLDKSIAWVIDTNLPNYQTLYRSLSPTQTQLLRAIAAHEQKLTSGEVAQEYGLGSSAMVIKNKKTLLRKDILDDSGGDLQFQDPVFELWFKSL